MRARLSAIGAWMREDDRSLGLPWRMFWVGLAVRLLYITVAHTYRIRVSGDHFQFGWEMGRIARALALGNGYADPFVGHSGPTAWNPPLFPLLLAGVFRVFGVYTTASAWVILAIDSVFSAATAVAVYEIAWRCFGRGQEGRRIALWSGWLWALYPAAMQYAVRWVWEMSLTTMLFAFAIVLALRMRGVGQESDLRRFQSLGHWGVFGLLWGLIALSNSSLLMVLPVCAVWMIWHEVRRPGQWGAAVRGVLLAALCCSLVVSPWVWRNWRVFHAFVPMRANFGAELYESVRPPNTGFPYPTVIPQIESDPEFQRYRRLGEVIYSRQQGERGKAMVRAHPGLFFAHALQRVYFFWVSVPHPIEKGIAAEIGREMSYCFLSLGGLLGLALALRRRIAGASLFLLAFAIVPLMYYFVIVQARFRHPLEPLLTVLIVFLFQAAEVRRRTRKVRA